MDMNTLLLSVVGFLFAGNCYFVKRLVDSMDQTKNTVRFIEIDMAVVKTHLGINTDPKKGA